MASGDAGEILRQISNLDYEIRKLKKILEDVQSDVQSIRRNMR